MNGRILGCAVVGAGLFLAVTALAGYKNTTTVYVDATNRQAFGAIGAARSSSDSVQFIGCFTASYANDDAYVACYAKNSAGTQVSCVSHDPQLVQASTASTSHSYVRFIYDASGNCTFIQISNYSYHSPLQP